MKNDRASATARLIARSTVFLSYDPSVASLIAPKTVQACLWFSGLSTARFVRACRLPWFRVLIRGIERRTLPGILNHYILRKRFIEDAARVCLADGFRQMVVFGAGFDTLALRLSAEWPETMFFEADHPATQSLKSEAFPADFLSPDNFMLIPANFSEADWPRALLSSPRYDPAADTFFVAEGLLMYLSQTQVEAMFDFIRAHSGARTRFAFTFLEPQAGGTTNFEHPSRVVDFWLRLRGEPFQWGISQSDLPPFLQQHGFRLRETIEADALQRRSLPQSEWRERVCGDLIGVAERREPLPVRLEK